jgi:Asp-tRNA(Asn)/Glu-tRNA(Gln) amidotransferase C subunit
LSEENKALVSNYETLVADEKQYGELKKAAEAAALADAKEQLAATLVELQAVKALAGQYEAVDIETAVTDAIIAANAILNSDEVTSQEVYAANATAQSELTTALMDLLDMAKKQLDDALSALLEEGDSEACQQIIAEAIEAVDLLEIDWTKTVEANATDIATNGQAIYDQALADLEAQRKAEQEPTGLEQTNTNDEWQMKNFHATKVMENGVLYLLHEGRMYDVRGARVR